MRKLFKASKSTTSKAKKKRPPKITKTSKFIKTYIKRTTDDIGIKVISNDGKVVHQESTRDPKKIRALIKKYNGEYHIFFSVVTRKKGGGKKEHCREVIWLWADIDFKDFPGGEDEARRLLTSFGFPPSAVIKSGGGLHVYWLLNETVDAQKKMKEVETALKIISKEVGGDSSRTDISSLLRLPDTINVKPERNGAKCVIESLDLNKTIDLSDILASIPQQTSGQMQSTDWKTNGLVELKKAVKQGNRDQGALDYVRAYVHQYGKTTDPEKLKWLVFKLLDKAGGDGLDAIKKKVPGWIENSIGLLEENKKLTSYEMSNLVVSWYNGRINHIKEEFRVYKNGYWKLLTENSLKKKIAKADIPHTNPSRTTSAVQNLKHLRFAEDTTKESDLICLKNGVLNPITGELKAHKPMPRFFNRLSIKWNTKAKCPLWKETLKQIFQGDEDVTDKILLLQQFFGYCLIRDTRQHKFLWMLGPGGNGKSLVLHILSAIIGSNNISRAMLHRLEEAYVRAQLLHKLVNISPEMGPNDNFSAGYLKSIVSGDGIEAENKYKPSFTFKPYSRIIASTNSLPRLQDHTYGFERRAIILPFNRVFKDEEQDKGLANKLEKELSGILLWAVEGLQKLREQDSFIIPPSSKVALAEYLKDEDQVKQFVDERLIKAEFGRLTSMDIYGKYVEWASPRNYWKLNVSSFGKRLKNLGFEKRKSNGQRVWPLKWRGSASGMPKGVPLHDLTFMEGELVDEEDDDL